MGKMAKKQCAKVTYGYTSMRIRVLDTRMKAIDRSQRCIGVLLLLLRMFWVKKIEKVPKVTLYAYLFKPNPPNSAK